MTLTCLLTAFVTFLIIFNAAMWLAYGRDLQRQIRLLGAVNRNLHGYIDELQQRCERYKAAAKIIEISEHPVVRVHPINANTITIYKN